MLSGLTNGYYTSDNPYGFATATNYNLSLYAHTELYGAGTSSYECAAIDKNGSSLGGLHGSYPNQSNLSGRWVNSSMASCSLYYPLACRTLFARDSVRVGYNDAASGFSHGHITLT